MTDFPLLSGLLWAFGAFLAVLVLIPLARKYALKVGFVDEPDGERKDHDEAVPPIGGLVIFPVYIITAMLMGFPLVTYWPLFAALFMLLVIGALDDRYHINAWVKFSGHIGAAILVVVFGQARLYTLGDLFSMGTFGLGFMSIPFSLAAVVLLINAMNLMDGLDGLAGGKGFVVLFWLALAAWIAGDPYAITALLPLMGALLGFLYYNMRHPWRDKATVFMGDAGTLSLGLVLAWFCIGMAHDADPVVTPISIAWILALPIIDTCGQFYRRVKEGRHPFSADRGHFHHHFIHAGIPVGRSTVLILLLGFLLGGVGYLGVIVGVPAIILTLAWIALLFIHMYLSRHPERYIHIVKRFNRRA